MVSQFLVGWIDVWFVATGLRDPGLQFIRNNQAGNPAKITKDADMGADPVGQGLTLGSFGIGIVGGAQDS